MQLSSPNKSITINRALPVDGQVGQIANAFVQAWNKQIQDEADIAAVSDVANRAIQFSSHGHIPHGINIHSPVSYVYATDTVRLASTGFVASDLYKIAYQVGGTSPGFYVLTAITPTWTRLGSGGSTSGTTGKINIIIDGNNSPPDGVTKGVIEIPSAIIVTKWYIYADDVGDANVNIFAGDYASYPPTVSLIGSGTIPFVSSSDRNTGNCNDWQTTTIPSNSVLVFSVSGATVLTNITLVLDFTIV